MSLNLKNYDNIVSFIKTEILQEYFSNDNEFDIKKDKVSREFIFKCLKEYEKLHPKMMGDENLIKKLHDNDNVLDYFDEYVGFGRDYFDEEGNGYINLYYNEHEINNIEPHTNLSADENLYRLILKLKENEGIK